MLMHGIHYMHSFWIGGLGLALQVGLGTDWECTRLEVVLDWGGFRFTVQGWFIGNFLFMHFINAYKNACRL